MRVRVWIGVALMALPGICQGAEHVTLRNGFALNCDHHGQVSDHTRLYLGAGDDNFIEFLTDEITNIENIPTRQTAPQQSTEPVRGSASAKLSTADLHEMLGRAGQERNLDIDLLASVVHAESGGNPNAVSRAGAKGLMQLMPATATELGVKDSFRPDQNVQGGSAYLDSLLARYHDNLALALAAYNAGPQAVDRYHGIPPFQETRIYVARVIHEFNRRVREREAALQMPKSN